MENVLHIVKIIVLITELTVLTILLDGLFFRKTISRSKKIATYIGCGVSIYIVAAVIPFSPIKLIITGALNLIVAISLYETTLLKKILAIGLYIGIMLFSDLFSMQIFPHAQYFFTDDIIKRNIIGILMIVVSHSIQFIIVNIINRINNIKNIKYNNVEWLTYIAPFSIIGIVIIVLNYETQMYDPIKQLGAVIIVCMGLLLSNIFLWKMFEYMIEQDRQRIRYESIQEKIKKQYLYYRNIEIKQEESKKMWHDINNHLSCIQLLLQAGHSDEANKYVNKIDITISKLRGLINTGNLITDAIMNEKYDFARSNHINMRVDIDLEGVNFIDNIDLCTIYSNLLDNAIEASVKLPENEREIIISSKVIKSCLVIKILNNTLENLEIKNNKIATSKKDKNNHGIGIMNICETINKYNGNIAMNCENKKFTTNIMIPLKK
ncbi:MAG: sensor histidine kinase [Cellulosilyticaceae bacterium]